MQSGVIKYCQFHVEPYYIQLALIIVKLIQLPAVHTSFFQHALGYAPIPMAISLTDSGLISHQTVTITTDIDCYRTYSGSIEADCTTRDR